MQRAQRAGDRAPTEPRAHRERGVDGERHDPRAQCRPGCRTLLVHALDGTRHRDAVVGPLADDAMGMLGCYSFPAHVGVRHPEHGLGIDIPSVLDGLRAIRGEVPTARGCDVTDPDRVAFEHALLAKLDRTSTSAGAVR